MTITGINFDDVTIGETLPSAVVPITTSLIVAGALASRNFAQVHHDPTHARERGADDLFMNILTNNGLVCKYLTDWAGPSVRVRSISIRLGAPSYPDDALRYEGSVAERNGNAVTVKFTATNSRGTAVSGTAVLEFGDHG